MKKKLLLVLSLLIIIFMTSCTSSKTYSFEEASGFEVTSLNSIKASECVYQSFAWPISDEVYEYLDCKYVKVDFDINSEYLSTWPPSELKDDAYVLHTYIEGLDSGINFYISHNTRYMYFNGIDGTYRSKNKMSEEFIDIIKQKNN
ncbi:MAG: hypothetical protein K5765_00885 [Clostridia bacterium]|nr:hypothetical protein [Clostridia bacterium]